MAYKPITVETTVDNADDGKRHILGGNACYALTFGAATSYNSEFRVDVSNIDTGRAKIISLNGVGHYIYPGQTYTVFAFNGAWEIVRPRRWGVAGNVTLYTDYTNGDDANDGLVSTSPMKTAQAALMRAFYNFDFGGQNNARMIVTVQLADNTTDESHIHFPPHAVVGAQGGATIIVKGGTNSKISTPSGENIGCYFGGPIQFENVEISAPGRTAMSVNFGAIVYLKNVRFGAAQTQLSIGPNSMVLYNNGGNSIVGDATYAHCVNSGVYDAQQQPLSLDCDMSPTYFVHGKSGSQTLFGGASIYQNNHTVTGREYYLEHFARISPFAGSVIPGTIAGINNGGYVG